MKKSIIYALRNGGFYNNDKTDEAIAWLEKQGKQNTIWKPIEEQIKALEHLVANVKRSAYSFFFEDKAELLYSLLEQLKKL